MAASTSDAADIERMFLLQEPSALDAELIEAEKTRQVVKELTAVRAVAAEATRAAGGGGGGGAAADADMMPSPSPAMSAAVPADAAALPFFFLGESAWGLGDEPSVSGGHSGSSAAGASDDGSGVARGAAAAVPPPDYFELQFSPAFKSAGDPSVVGAGAASGPGAASAGAGIDGNGFNDANHADDDDDEGWPDADGDGEGGEAEAEEVALYWGDTGYAADIEGGMRLTLPPDMRMGGDHHELVGEGPDVADVRDLECYDELDDHEAAVYDKMDGSLPRSARKRRQGGGGGGSGGGGGGGWR